MEKTNNTNINANTAKTFSGELVKHLLAQYAKADKANKELSKTNVELSNANECLKAKLSNMSRQFMADHVQEAIYNFHADNTEFREKVVAGYELRKALVRTLDESQKDMLYDFIRSLEISTSYLLSEVFREGVKACNVYGETLEYSNYLDNVETTDTIYGALPTDMY